MTSSLTIGDLAQRTGVAPATLRVWESRHGFPRPSRRDSGHRRYDEHDVELVTQVLRRRDSGMRLEVAIAGVALADAATGTRRVRRRSTPRCAACTRTSSRSG